MLSSKNRRAAYRRRRISNALKSTRASFGITFLFNSCEFPHASDFSIFNRILISGISFINIIRRIVLLFVWDEACLMRTKTVTTEERSGERVSELRSECVSL